MRISRKALEAMPPDSFLWDRSFGVKRTETGTRLFVVNYRLASGRRRRFTIGEYEPPWSQGTAQIEAQRLLGLVATGIDPLEHKAAARSAITIRELLERVTTEHLPKRKPKTAYEYARIFEAHLAPTLGARAVAEIDRSDVAKLHHKLRSTPRQANLVIAVLSKVMTLAETWGLRSPGSHPCRQIEKYREVRRERFLSTEELGRLGAALAEAESQHTASVFALAAVKLLLLTGARVGEMLGLRWDAIDVEAGTARLADSKTG